MAPMAPMAPTLSSLKLASGFNRKILAVGNRRINPGAPSLEQGPKKSGSNGRHGGKGRNRGCCGSPPGQRPSQIVEFCGDGSQGARGELGLEDGRLDV